MNERIHGAIASCKQSFIAVAVFSGVANLLMLVPAFFMLNVYDKAIAHQSFPTLWSLSLIAVFLFGMLAAMEIIRSKLLIYVSERLDRQLSPALAGLTLEHAVLTGAAKASTQPLRDLAGLRNFISGTGLLAILDAPWVPIYLAVMFAFHPLLGWLGVIAVIVFLILAIVNQAMVGPPLSEANTLARQNEADIQQNLSNAPVTAAMGMTAPLIERWQMRQEEILAFQGDASSASAWLTGITKTLRLATQSAAIAAGAYLVLNQEISPGMLIAGSILVGRALAPVELVVAAWRGISDARDQYQRLNELLNSAPPEPERLKLPALVGNVVGHTAAITPPGEKVPVVQNLTFDVPAGSSLMVIGPSGSGKSTFARALLGLWPTSAGEIRIDGTSAYEFNRSDIGPQVGYLPQDIELMHGTVAENIARFGTIVDEDVIKAATDAGVHQLILNLRHGYETKIGGKGGALSQGQMQRIALARAIYQNPALVVLDEPNSNLDQDGEKALEAALLHVKASGSTLVMISHRQNILSMADYVMVIVGGVMQQFGKRDDVLASLRGPTRQSN